MQEDAYSPSLCTFAGSLVASHAAPAAAAAARNVMALEGKYPDMDPVLKVLKNNEPELSAYLGDPETVCTFFIPSGKVRANMCSVHPGTSTAAVVLCAQNANQQL
jgi:hypothetical protein